jgi:predicted AAA+ superfamily ATPase
MLDIFRPHNLHWHSVGLFKEQDPQLYNLPKQIFVHEPSLLKQLPTTIPGIYTIGGGRQIGKTTLLKQWMSVLLENGRNPKSLFFMTGELIADHIALIQIVQEYLNQQSSYKECMALIKNGWVNKN